MTDPLALIDGEPDRHEVLEWITEELFAELRPDASIDIDWYDEVSDCYFVYTLKLVAVRTKEQ